MKKTILCFALLVGISLSYGNDKNPPIKKNKETTSNAYTVLYGSPAVFFSNTIFCGYNPSWCALLFTNKEASKVTDRIRVQVQDTKKTTFTANSSYLKKVNPDQSTLYTFKEVKIEISD
ncbi:hypothetical protein [Flavobacterium sp. JP2137]|uniref:hypothetical protein n=1 Tax=Flavobacterium sp. JP2137 TaxID=3414510 RepID=UPI003D2FACDF